MGFETGIVLHGHDFTSFAKNALIVAVVLALSACSAGSPRGYTHSEREAVLETYYSVVDGIRELARQQGPSIEEHFFLNVRAQEQLKAGDYAEGAATLAEAAIPVLDSAHLLQTMINLIDVALEKCLPKEAIELLELRRSETSTMLAALDSTLALDREAALIALAMERQEDDMDPYYQSGIEVADVLAGRVAEAEIAHGQRVQREKEILAGSLTRPSCD